MPGIIESKMLILSKPEKIPEPTELFLLSFKRKKTTLVFMKFFWSILFSIPALLFASDFDEETINDTILANLYFQKGDSGRIAENFDDALNWYLQAAALYNEKNIREKEAEVFNRVGKVYRLIGNYEKALENDIKSLQLIDNLPSSKNKALYINNIGIDQYRLQHYEKALGFLSESLQMRREISDSLGIADAFNNIGMVHDDKGELEKALGFLSECIGFL
jgi:tetratricopeptide (TPR) repeat protein